MKTLLFGCERECSAVTELLVSAAIGCASYEYRQTEDLEVFEEILATWMPTLVVVLADGATGMECVYRSRSRRPNLPVFWFSNDREFGMQSYRLGCAYFSTKPVTPEKIACALRRCDHVGISYATS